MTIAYRECPNSRDPKGQRLLEFLDETTGEWLGAAPKSSRMARAMLARCARKLPNGAPIEIYGVRMRTPTGRDGTGGTAPTAIWHTAFGMLHRIDGPAVEHPDGTQEWWQYNRLHRDDGPAIEAADGARFWYRLGKRHRVDGPAVIRADGSCQWWVQGRQIAPPDKA